MIPIEIHSASGPRENLEDAALASVLVGPLGVQAPLLVVGDGVGGANAGEVAGAIGVQTVLHSLEAFVADRLIADSVINIEDTAVALYCAMLAANDAVLDRAAEAPELAGMATTIVCGVVVDSTLVLGWAGDSRCYLRSGCGLHRLTSDHTEAAALVEAGAISPSESIDHPGAHTVTEYLGKPEDFKPQRMVTTLSPGDWLLLCTDGLTDVLSDHQIDQFITSQWRSRSIGGLARALVGAAIEAGTSDNTTALIYRHRSPTGTAPFSRTRTHDYAAALAAVLNHLSEEKNHASVSTESERATVTV